MGKNDTRTKMKFLKLSVILLDFLGSLKVAVHATDVERYMVDCGSEAAKEIVQKTCNQEEYAKEREQLKNLEKEGICICHLTLDQANKLSEMKDISFVELDSVVHALSSEANML